jgi:ribosome-associated heat shock protein Hsp15
MTAAERVRVDRWLWAVRAYKTRAQANDACSKGRVRVNGEVCKPATRVGPGDRVEARRKDRTLLYELVQPLEKRVGAARAADAMIDHSPPVEPPIPVASTGQRDRGAGRPTKRERRRIQELRGR